MLGVCPAPPCRAASEASEASAAAVRADSRPNILLIVADDLGFSDLGAYGSEIATPTLDALAARGLQLTNFHTGPTCSPTRAMLLTGVDHHRAGLGAMAEALQFNPRQRGQPGYEGHLNERVVSIATLLADAGYATRMVGKWHLGSDPANLPSARGFEHSFAMLAGGAQHFDGTRAIHFDPESLLREDGREASWPSGRYSSDYYTDRMIKYLRTAPQERPLFAYVAYTAPHWPLQAPDANLARYKGRYSAGWDAVRAARLSHQKQLGLIDDPSRAAPRPASVPAWSDLTVDQQARASRLMEIYAAMVDNLDRNVGRLLAEWQRTGRDRNAVIVFMSDNGAEQMAPEAAMLPGLADWIAKNFDNSLDNLGHAGSYVGYGSGWANVSNAPFRGFKGLAYEGGVRTAGIVVWPGVRAARVDDYVNVLDLPPTLLHLAGVAPPDGSYKGRPVLPMEGRSLVGNSGQFAAADPQRTSAHELFGHRGVVRGDLKAVSTWTGATGPGPWQLHDLSTDPGEQHDLAAVRAPELASLSAWFERWAKENGVIEPARNAPVYGKE